MQPENEDQKLTNEILRDLLDSNQLEGPSAGIVRQVLARGEGTLSERQAWVFDNHVRAKHLDRVCDFCGELIPLAEVAQSWGNGGLCASCAFILGKQGD